MLNLKLYSQSKRVALNWRGEEVKKRFGNSKVERLREVSPLNHGVTLLLVSNCKHCCLYLLLLLMTDNNLCGCQKFLVKAQRALLAE